MKKKILKLVSITTAVIIVILALSVGSTAEETIFFSGSAGTGITIGTVNDRPFYTTFGSAGIYTSVDGENWLKRYADSTTPISNLDSVAYGKGMGIGVKSGEITAKLFTRDMNIDKDVYNFVEGVDGGDGYFIYLIPEVYYDNYSSLYFCHGFNSEANDFDLYYSDGVAGTATYSGSTVAALTWTKVTGDFLDVHPWDYNGPDNDQNFTLAWLAPRHRFITGNGNGYILVPYATDLNTRCAPVSDCSCGAKDIRRTCTVLKTTQNGEVTGAHAYTTAVMLPRAAAITENGVAVLQPSGTNTTLLYVADLDAVDFETGNIVSFAAVRGRLSDYVDNDNTAAVAVCGNDIYFTKPATNKLYKMTAEKINGNISISVAENILENSSYGDSGSSAWTVKDMEIIDETKAVMLLNSASGAYVYEVNLETGGLKALTSDDTYVSIDGNDAVLTIAPNTYRPHGLQLQIGDDDPTTDKMIYECSNTDEAKYLLDLDGIDVNGIFAWDDAESSICSFTLTAISADYPSVMRTVEITANVGE